MEFNEKPRYSIRMSKPENSFLLKLLVADSFCRLLFIIRGHDAVLNINYVIHAVSMRE